MKRRFLLGCVVAVAPVMQSVSANAADLGPPIASIIPYPTFNWTGLYIGANIGGGWTGGNIADTLTGSSFAMPTQAGFIGGGQIGYNYQISPNVVLGVEWFMDGAANDNSNNTINVVSVPALNGNLLQVTTQTDWVTTITGRIGFTSPAFDHWLFYAKGGGGWIQSQAALTNVATGASVSTTKTNGGWVAGVGMEWAFLPSWTLKVEYQYLGLNPFTLSSGLVADTFNVNNANVQMATVGVDYLFNWSTPPSIAARY